MFLNIEHIGPVSNFIPQNNSKTLLKNTNLIYLLLLMKVPYNNIRLKRQGDNWNIN